MLVFFSGVLIDEMNGATSAASAGAVCVFEPRVTSCVGEGKRKISLCFTGTSVSISALSKT